MFVFSLNLYGLLSTNLMVMVVKNGYIDLHAVSGIVIVFIVLVYAHICLNTYY